MFYVSALLAIVGATGYQYFVKKISPDINPVVSVIALYAALIPMAALLLPLFPMPDGLAVEVKRLSWVQLAVAVSVLLIELGFLLMYRHGWQLSTGNLITGVAINIALVGLGVWLLGERVSLINLAGIALCIAGVGLIGYRN
jgi:drug/metabolite transporter (DMT)-like permease